LNAAVWRTPIWIKAAPGRGYRWVDVIDSGGRRHGE